VSVARFAERAWRLRVPQWRKDRRSNSRRFVLLGVGVFFATTAMAGAGALPLPDSKPLSAILQAVERQALDVITSAEFDDGQWEVKVCQHGTCLKLYIDPRSGMEHRRRPDRSSEDLPPAHARPLLPGQLSASL
jgi:hypothetical protein